MLLFVLFPLTSFAAEPVYLSAVSEVLKELRPAPSLSEVDTFLKKAPALKTDASLQQASQQISAYIFDDLKIKADDSFQSRNNKDNILPDSVLKTKQGHCLGLTILFLLAAEKSHWQAALVRGPDHVFPRLCRKDQCVNIEMLRHGEIKEDSYYVQNLLIPKEALDKKLYLQNLESGPELKASIYLGLGYVANHAGQKDLAELFYRKSAENSTTFAEPHTDLAAIMAESGRGDEARAELKKALAINPTHYASLLNLGLIEQKTGHAQEALTDYGQAIAANPLAVRAYRQRSEIYESRHDMKSALLDLDRILVIQPKACDVIQDRQRLEKSSSWAQKLQDLQRSGTCRHFSD